MFMLDSEVEEFFQKKLKVTDHMVITLFAPHGIILRFLRCFGVDYYSLCVL